jgi:hypothetical protein
MILDLIALENGSRVWVYQCDQRLNEEQVEGIRNDLWQFLDQWTSHNSRLYTYGNVFHELFLVFFVDERYAGASGCSIDKSVHFVEDLEKKYGVNFFGRTDVAYMEKAEDEEGEDISAIHICKLDDLKSLYSNGKINDHTFVFDNLVQTKGDFLKRWVLPLNESWHRRYL